MTKDEVQLGKVYALKLGKKTIKVRIDSETGDGFNGTDLATGEAITVDNPKALRYEVVIKDDPKAKKKPAKKKAAKSEKPKKLGCLSAAAQVLSEGKTAMTCQELIDAMRERKLWSSPAGKTPSATLYAAITREIAVKGKEARFKKIGRGQFSSK